MTITPPIGNHRLVPTCLAMSILCGVVSGCAYRTDCALPVPADEAVEPIAEPGSGAEQTPPISIRADDPTLRLTDAQQQAILDKQEHGLAYWEGQRFGVRLDFVEEERFQPGDQQVINDLHGVLCEDDPKNWWPAARYLAHLGGDEHSAAVLIDYMLRPVDLQPLDREQRDRLITGKCASPLWLGYVHRTHEQDAYLRYVATQEGAQAIVTGWFADGTFPQGLLSGEAHAVSFLRGSALQGLVLSNDEANIAYFQEQYDHALAQAHAGVDVGYARSQLIEAMAALQRIRVEGYEDYLENSYDINRTINYIQSVRAQWPQ